MLGGYFNRNLPQGTIAVLKVEDTKHPATKMLGAGWPIVDEFYLFGTAPWDAARPDDNIDVLFKNKIPMGFSRDRVHVLLSLDTERMDLSKQPNLKRGGDYPQAWTREYGKGRIVLHVARSSRRYLEQRPGVSGAHQRRHSMGARARAVALAVFGLGAWVPGLELGGPRRAAPLPAPAFHHLHLNSVNPDAAIEFYIKGVSRRHRRERSRVSRRCDRRTTCWCCSTRSRRRRRRSRRPRSGISGGTSPTCARPSIAF